ncbi:hypothetical protein SATMO3_48720 [Sporomusa aerivorans]
MKQTVLVITSLLMAKNNVCVINNFRGSSIYEISSGLDWSFIVLDERIEDGAGKRHCNHKR